MISCYATKKKIQQQQIKITPLHAVGLG